MNNRGRLVAAESLRVNYRTMAASYESRRTRRALEEYRDADGDDVRDMVEMAAALEKENRALREAV